MPILKLFHTAIDIDAPNFREQSRHRRVHRRRSGPREADYVSPLTVRNVALFLVVVQRGLVSGLAIIGGDA